MEERGKKRSLKREKKRKERHKEERRKKKVGREIDLNKKPGNKSTLGNRKNINNRVEYKPLKLVPDF